jgi:carbon-monoxide dehydrogenase medium subunit
MKPARFDYAAATTLGQAAELLRSAPSAKLVAGGQTLGPMLNLRLVQPALLVDITRIPELTGVAEEADWITYGACITHAAIEDGRVPDATAGALPRIARGIAYRAVRTRGTIGGSLAHADPAADWLSALAAIGAEVVASDGKVRRGLPVARLMTGVFETALAPDEILTAVRVPRLPGSARFGYHKLCRKTGEFAEAIGAVLVDPERGLFRAVAGATEAAPIVIEDAGPLLGGDGRLDRAAVRGRLREAGLSEPYALQLHAVALERAAAEVRP